MHFDRLGEDLMFKTSEVLFFLLLFPVWLDLRTASTVEKLLEKTSDKNKDHLRVREEKSFRVVKLGLPHKFLSLAIAVGQHMANNDSKN